MLEYLECEEVMGGVGDRECCTSSGLTRIPSFRRKLSEVGTASTATSISEQSSSSSLARTIKPNKPCLKRRSSVPPQDQEMSSTMSLRQCRGSCDSLGGSSVDFEDADSSLGIGSSRSSGSDVGSFSSRKSVSFADSVGEDLCHIKVFMKEQHELDLQEMSWHQRMWRWQNGYFNNGNSTGSSSDWYFGDEDEEEEEEEDYDEYNNGYYFNSFDAIHEVEIEEDEDEQQQQEDDDDDDTIFMGRRLPNFEDPVVQQQEEVKEVTTQSSTSSSASSSVVVSPTFISPCDLPDYPSRLSDSGVLLESVSIIGSSSNGSTLISGTVALNLPSFSKSSSIPLPSVSVRYSTDAWADSSSTSAATAFVAGSRYGFVVDASRLTIGDDLELVIDCEYNGQKWTDDNAGSCYRFICKNKPRFQPGKSLW